MKIKEKLTHPNNSSNNPVKNNNNNILVKKLTNKIIKTIQKCEDKEINANGWIPSLVGNNLDSLLKQHEDVPKSFHVVYII